MSDIITKSSEATKGGYQAIRKVEGVLQPIKRVPSKFESGFGGKPAPDQAEIVLEEAVILEMEAGEPEPELKDDRFVTWMTYAPPGKEKPHASTFYIRGFVKSGEALDAARRGVDPTEGMLTNLYGTRVILQRQPVLLGKVKKEGSEEKQDLIVENFVFIRDEAGSGVDIKGHIRGLVIGSTPPAAKRNLLLDNKAKLYPEYRKALENETLAEMLGLELRDGKFCDSNEREAD